MLLARNFLGKSRGFGFVEFAEASEAQCAQMLSDSQLGGREIVVSQSQRGITQKKADKTSKADAKEKSKDEAGKDAAGGKRAAKGGKGGKGAGKVGEESLDGKVAGKDGDKGHDGKQENQAGKEGKAGKGAGKDSKEGKGAGKKGKEAGKDVPKSASRRRLSFGPEAGIEPPVKRNRANEDSTAPEPEEVLPASKTEPEATAPAPMSNADFRKLLMGAAK